MASSSTGNANNQSTTKIGKVIALLKRKQGASLDELGKATGWQHHTIRASLTGLRKKGFVIDRSLAEGLSRYAIASEPSQ